jgi:VanZ family protein
MPAANTITAILRISFVIALIAGFWLSLLPAPEGVQWLAWQDKAEHFAFFVLLALLGVAAWTTRPGGVAGALLLYGLAMEVAQSFTPYRLGDPLDWVADALGVGAGLLAAHTVGRLRVRRTA